MKSVCCVAVVASLFAGAAQAEDPARSAALSQAVLAAPCFNCHGPDAKGAAAIPGLAGRPAEALLLQLKEFKAGSRSATVMTRLAKGYSDQQLDSLAQYFAAVR